MDFKQIWDKYKGPIIIGGVIIVAVIVMSG